MSQLSSLDNGNSKQTLQLSPLPECIIREEMDQLNIIRPTKRVLEERLFCSGLEKSPCGKCAERFGIVVPLCGVIAN